MTHAKLPYTTSSSLLLLIIPTLLSAQFTANFGKQLTFTGIDYCTASASQLSFHSEVTIISRAQVSGIERRLFSFLDGGSEKFSIYARRTGGDVAGIRVEQASGPSIPSSSQYAEIPVDSNWSTFAFRRASNGAVSLFIDGIKFDYGSPQWISPASSPNVVLGGPINSVNAFFLYDIDCTAAFSVALSDDDIVKFVESDPTGSEPGLIAAWTFDEASVGANQAFLDLSPNAISLVSGSSMAIEDGDPVVSAAPWSSAYCGTSGDVQFRAIPFIPGLDQFSLSFDPFPVQTVINPSTIIYGKILSPGGTLNFQPYLVAAQVLMNNSSPSQSAPNVWLDPLSTDFIILTPSQPFTTVIDPALPYFQIGHVGGLVGSDFSVILQTGVLGPNSIVLSNAYAIRFPSN